MRIWSFPEATFKGEFDTHPFQVRIILNKADEITAEELLKIQGNLVWNVSPLMASMEPPTLYAGSFWSRPYKVSKTSDQNEI